LGALNWHKRLEAKKRVNKAKSGRKKTKCPGPVGKTKGNFASRLKIRRSNGNKGGLACWIKR